ncbi:hypothetical protein GCM10009624_02100 [Gordonia sinesedis]
MARICYQGRSHLGGTPGEWLLSSSKPPVAAELDPAMVVVSFYKDGSEPPAMQRGPAARPTANVFGGWYMTEYRESWPKGDPTAPNPRAECGDMGDLTAPGPSYPGWPTARGE